MRFGPRGDDPSRTGCTQYFVMTSLILLYYLNRTKSSRPEYYIGNPERKRENIQPFCFFFQTENKGHGVAAEEINRGCKSLRFTRVYSQTGTVNIISNAAKIAESRNIKNGKKKKKKPPTNIHFIVYIVT